MKNFKKLHHAAVALFCLFAATAANASVESTLNNVQSKLINTILPAISIMGLVIAGLSFAMGNENAKRHVGWAIAGTILGFAAPSIISFLQGLAH